MLEKRPEDSQPPGAQPPSGSSQKKRDIAREDADSPHGIPLAPPHGDGS